MNDELKGAIAALSNRLGMTGAEDTEREALIRDLLWEHCEPSNPPRFINRKGYGGSIEHQILVEMCRIMGVDDGAS